MKELRAIAGILTLSTLALLFCGAFMPGDAASAGPSISITQPVHGAVVQGTVTVAVSYRSDSGVNVTHLEFYVDKNLQKAVKLEAPGIQGEYSFLWDSNGLSDGVHNVTAIAYDAKGNTAHTAVSIYLDARQATAPATAEVGIDGVRDGQVVSGLARVMATGLDRIGVRAMVMFFLDNKPKLIINRPPYRYTLDSTQVPNGPHSLKVEAWDADTSLGESTVSFYVDNPGGRTLPNERPSEALASAKPTPAPAPTATAPKEARVIPLQSRQPAAPAQPTTQVARRELAPLPVPPPAGLRPAPVVSQPTVSATARQPELVVSIDPDRAGNATSPAVKAVTPAARAGQPSLSSTQPNWDRVAVASTPEWHSAAPFANQQRATLPGERRARPTLSDAFVATDGVLVSGQFDATRGSFLPSASSATLPAESNLRPVMSIARLEAQGVTPMLGFDGVTARFGAAGAHLAAPAVVLAPADVAAPALGSADFAPQMVALAAAISSPSLAPVAGASRTAMPNSSRLPVPAVSASAPAGSTVAVALLDRQQQRVVPVAVRVARAAEPPATRKQLPAGVASPAPVKKLVLQRKGSGTVEIVFNGRPVEFGAVKPMTQDGMALAPFRHIFEHNGGVILWDNLMKQVKASGDGRRVEFTIGSVEALVNDKTVQMQTAPFLQDGRAIVPLSFIRDALDVVVEYDAETGRITIAAK